MKKVLSLIFVFILATLVLPISVFAATPTATLSASASSIHCGDSVTITVKVSNCSSPSLGIIPSFDTNTFELVSGEWLLTGAVMSDFSDGCAVIAYTSNQSFNGNVFKFTLKAKTAAKVNKYTVSCEVSAEGYSTVNPSATIQIACKTHSYTSWEKVSETQHKRTCSVCGSVETANHTWNSGKITKAATCKETGTKVYNCSACGATKTETIPKTTTHSYGAWTKSDKTNHVHTCSVCGKTETKAHSWDNGKVSKAATCKETGIKTYTCTICGETKTETIAKTTAHKYGAYAVTSAATCTGKGIETATCTICGSKTTREIAPLGHKFSNPIVTKAATCTADGEETGTCTRCGKTTVAVIKATGHKFGAWTSDKAATCTEGGTEKRTCSACKTEEKRDTKALGHSFSNPKIVKEPTISTTGLKQGTCSSCGKTTDEIIPCSCTDPSTGIVFGADEGVFSDGTTITVKKIGEDDEQFKNVQEQLNDQSDKITAYYISSKSGETEIQPNGTVTMTLPVLLEYGTNIGVFAIDNGAQPLTITPSADGKTILVTTDKLGLFAVCDLDNKADPTVVSTASPTEAPIATNAPTEVPVATNSTEPKETMIPESTEAANGSTETDKNAGKKKIAIIGGACGLVALIVLLIVLFLLKKKKEKQN